MQYWVITQRKNDHWQFGATTIVEENMATVPQPENLPYLEKKIDFIKRFSILLDASLLGAILT